MNTPVIKDNNHPKNVSHELPIMRVRALFARLSQQPEPGIPLEINKVQKKITQLLIPKKNNS